jgi:D-amino-acid dehydrogenase
MSKRVCIVGGGVIGLCTAYYALQRGHRVTLIEREPAENDGCSVGNAGLITPSHFVPLSAPGVVALGLRMLLNPESPFWIRPRFSWELLSWGTKFLRAANAAQVARSAPLLRDLNLASRCAYEDLAETLGADFGLEQRGLLMLCRTAAAFREEQHLVEMARALGVSAEALTPDETARLEPNLRMEIAGAVYFPQDCHLIPGCLLAALRRHLEAGGAQICWNTTATGWRVRASRIEAVETDRGEFPAEAFALAGGAWSPELARSLGLSLPMQAGKGYSLTLPNPPGLPSRPAILTEARVAVTPMGTALRFAGTMEITGLDRGIAPRRVQSVSQYLPDFTPDVFRDIPAWSGLRPCSPDGLPYIGRSGRYANLCIAAGHAMLGLSLGPITGKLVAELLSDEPTSLPLTALSPDRYAASGG